ncbi:MAG: DNA methyltransferase [Thermoplasmata archaeon]
MKFVSEFPKNYRELSSWELKGLLEAYGGIVSGENEDLLFFETDRPLDIVRRIAFSKRISRIIDQHEFPIKLQENGSYAIKEIRSENMVSLIEETAKRIIGKVNLNNPDRKFIIYNNENFNLIGEIIYERSISNLIDQKYKSRPLNHPSSISPLLARGMINISGVKEGKIIVDPFAGTGTILIEAGRMGIEAIGIDKNSKMVEGGNKNLAHFSIKGKLIQGDFSQMKDLNNIYAVITDPPYGRGSKIFSESRKTLYKNFFTLLAGMKGTVAVFCLPSEDLLDELKNYQSFIVIQRLRVHSSLTRIVVKTLP